MIRRATDFYRSRVTKGSFGHHVLVMFFGTVMGQMGSLLLAPALTRIFTPESLGVLGSFTAIVTISSVIAALRYEMALPLAKTDEESINLLAVCGLSLVFSTLVGSLILFLLSPQGLNLTNYGNLAPYWFLLPFGFVCIGAYQIMVYFATQRGEYKLIARTKIYQGYAGPVMQVVMGLLGFNAWGLIFGFIIGQSTGSSLLFSRLVAKSKATRALLSWCTMKELAKRYRRFPLLSSWSGLINAAGTSTLLLIVIPAMYSHAIAGYVFLIDRVVGRPMLMVSSSILQVYMGDVSKTRTSDPAAMRSRFLQLGGRMLAIVSAWLLLVNLVAPFAFPLVFGEEWGAAVLYLRVLSFALLPQMVMHALIHTLQVLERQGLSALWESGRLLAVIGGFALSYALHFDALQALIVYSITQGIAQLTLFCLMYRSIQALQTPVCDPIPTLEEAPSDA